MIPWECKKCGRKDTLQEVVPFVNKYSNIDKMIWSNTLESLMFEFGSVTSEQGWAETIYYRCSACKESVTLEELKALVEDSDKK